MIKIIGEKNFLNDRKFWINIHDFINVFDVLSVCYFFSPKTWLELPTILVRKTLSLSLSLSHSFSLNLIKYKGEWNDSKKSISNILNSPQYGITVKKKC